MNWNYINSVLLLIILGLTFASLLTDISTSLSSKSSITDWLAVLIYGITWITALIAARIAYKAFKANKVVAEQTKKMADDNFKLVKAQTEPFVDIQLEVMSNSIHWVRLKIQNLGLSSAFNIQFKVTDLSENINNSKEVIKKYCEIPFMQEGLNYLSKGSVRYTKFINLMEDDTNFFTNDEFFSTKFIVEISYNDIEKNDYKHAFIISNSELKGSYAIGEEFNNNFLKEIKNINENLMEISKTQKSLRSYYIDLDDPVALETRLQLANIRKIQRKKLSKRLNSYTYKRESIQQIRKKMK